MLSLLLLSAAYADDEITVDRSSDGVIVRSPVDQGNFLFRTGPAFVEAEIPDEFLVHLTAERDGATAAILLQIVQPGAAEARMDLKAMATHRGDFRYGLNPNS